MAKKAVIEKKIEQADLLKTVSNEIDRVTETTGANLSPKQREQMKKVLNDIFIEGKLPAEAMGFDEEFIKQVYNIAYNRYNLGLYKDADTMFRFLCLLDPTSSRFRMGLAATNHRLKNYDAAIMLYFCVVNADPKNPLPLFYCYDCYMNMDNPFGAYCVLKSAVEICNDNPEHTQLKARCEQMMEGLQEKLEAFKTKNNK